MLSRRSLVSIFVSFILLFLVLRTIDFDSFKQAIRSMPLGHAIIGISVSIFIVPMMAIRWKLLLGNAGEPPNYRTCLFDHWSGMSIGWATPSSLGWDAYRATRMATRMGNFGTQVQVIIMEKVARLTACAVIALLLFPIQPLDSTSALFAPIHPAPLSLLLLTILLSTSLIFWSNFPKAAKLIKKFANKVIQRWNKSLDQDESEMEISYTDAVLAIVISSFPILVVSIGHVIFFDALNVEVGFLTILFVVSILDVLFSLPISFGSLGVREVGYVFFYGSFGVSSEIAILVSTLNLIGIVNNSILGAILARYSLTNMEVSPSNSD